MKIYKTPKSDKLFGVDIICSNCSKEMNNEFALLHYCWFDKNKSKQKSKAEVLCKDCIEKKNKLFHVEESYVIICVDKTKIMPDMVPFIHQEACLNNSKTASAISVFQASSMDSEKTKDRTRHSGRETYEGISVGKTKEQVDYETKPKKRMTVIERLKEIQNAKPILPEYNEKNLHLTQNKQD